MFRIPNINNICCTKSLVRNLVGKERNDSSKMSYVRYFTFQKLLRKFDIGRCCEQTIPCRSLRFNLKNLLTGKSHLHLDSRWNSLLQLQKPSLYPNKSNLRHYSNNDRFWQIDTRIPKFIKFKHNFDPYIFRMPTLDNISISSLKKQKRQIFTYSEFLHARYYGTEAANQVSEPRSAGLLEEPIQDVPAISKDILRSPNKTSSKQSKRAAKQELLKQAEQSFAEMNKKHEETRQNFLWLFPIPKSSLHNLYQVIASHLNKTVSTKLTYERVDPYIWECQLSVTWPEEKIFKGKARSKQEAGNRAALGVLIWLQEMRVLNEKGQLSLLSKTDVQEAKRKPLADVTLSSEIVSDINVLLEKYSKEVLGYMGGRQDDRRSEYSDNGSENYLSEEDVLKPQNANLKSEDWLQQRNTILQDRHSKQSQIETYKLPISSYREEFLQLLKTNKVVVVKGEPGCGKSTQVPQFVFDDFASRMEGTNCKVVVTQPRRISAISLAEYIAQERGERVGDVTGYQVRLKTVLPHPQAGGIIFCSTGILLRKIINDPGLSDISHVIIDEAHERDINTDFLLALVKRAVEVNPELRVVIMSATINAELFQNYFNNAPALHIPGFTHPVKQRFLDNTMAEILGVRNMNEVSHSPQPRVDCQVVAKMVSWINYNRPNGAILVFLPGWAEIQQTLKHLESTNARDNQLYIVPIHSKLNYRQQKQIFDKPPKGMRKVILATNIAETSITIDDVVYVVDTGALKEERLDVRAGVACLDNHWVSQANVKQRQGRAGRVQPGESFHLYTKNKFDELDPFPTPEIFRVPLEKSVLDCKMYSATDEKIADFFSELPEPPNPKAVNQAVSVLQSLGALDSEEDLTPLGKRIYLFTMHPFLSKALVHSVILKCVNPILTIATLMSADYPLFYNTMENKEAIKSVKQKFSPCSDHMALAWLYHQWEEFNQQGSHKAESFCKERGINPESMALTQKLRILNGDYLHKSQLIDSAVKYTSFDENCNSSAKNDELVKGVLLSGVGKVLMSRNFKLMKGRMKHCNDVVTQTGQTAKVVSDSVNYGRKDFPSPFLTYYRGVSSLEYPVLKIWDSSIVSPITLLLFLPGIISMKAMKNLDSSKTILSIKGNAPINISCEQEQAKLILNLRQVLWTVVEYLVEHEGHPEDKQQYEVVSKFRDDMLQVLSTLVLEQGEFIDYNEEGELRTQ